MSEKKAAAATANPLTEMATNGVESGDKVERIRELIFGTYIRDYAQKFDLLNREISRLNRELERANQQLRDQETNFKRQLREESERLATQGQEQERRLVQQLQEQDHRQTQELESVDQKQSERLQALDQLMQNGDRELLEKLGELTEQLNDLKVDRSTLGDLFLELGSSLKSNSAAPLTTNLDLLDQLTAELA